MVSSSARVVVVVAVVMASPPSSSPCFMLAMAVRWDGFVHQDGLWQQEEDCGLKEEERIDSTPVSIYSLMI